MDDEEAADARAERRDARRAKAAKGMQVSNRNLKALEAERLEQRRRNAQRGHGPLTDDELRRGPR